MASSKFLILRRVGLIRHVDSGSTATGTAGREATFAGSAANIRDCGRLVGPAGMRREAEVAERMLADWRTDDRDDIGIAEWEGDGRQAALLVMAPTRDVCLTRLAWLRIDAPSRNCLAGGSP